MKIAIDKYNKWNDAAVHTEKGEDFGNYVKRRAADAEDIKRRINETIAQAECFYRCYGSILKKRKLKILKRFCLLKEYNPVMKRLIMIRHGFFKSGLLRNIVLMIYI